MKPGLSERAKQILKSLVDQHIATGQPVGSKTLSQLPDLACSPATVRNVMADLEAAGLIHSPHTSAGRVPTSQGYRLFVDSLLTTQRLDKVLLDTITEEFQHDLDQQALIESASNLLSGLTQMAGVVTTPKHKQQILRQVEFLKLSRQRILVILVLNESDVQNRIIITPREYSASELEQAGNYLTQKFAGMELSTVRNAFVEAMQADRGEIDRLMSVAMNLASDSLKVEDSNDYILAGQNNLFSMVDEDVAHLKSLFDAFSQKQQMLQLLDRSLSADGVQIYIGEESGFETFEPVSLVTAPYQTEDQDTIGIIGVIGPKRMAYGEVIPVVDMTAKLLSMALKK